MKENAAEAGPLPCGATGTATARYLLALLDLGRRDGKPTQAALSRAVGVTQASTFEMVARLRADGLVCQGDLALSAEGMSTALVLAARRDAARRFTHEVLGLEESEARAEAQCLATSGAAVIGRRLTTWRRLTPDPD